jgi:hypothetical protein
MLVLGCDWDETKLFLSKEDAIKASIQHPKERVEVFCKAITSGYKATYNYYRNGEYIQNT